MRSRFRATALIALLAMLAALSATGMAYGFAETPWPGRPDYGDTCFGTNCHGAPDGAGPHGGYSDSTRMCSMCHTLHDAPTGNKLLPRQTVTQTCYFCHDGTSAPGSGVYGAIEGRGLVVAAEHRVEVTNLVPGGAADGGDATMLFSEGGSLGCGDCHTAHRRDTVAPFTFERARLSTWDMYRVNQTTALLRKRPGNAATPVAEYGSDWCMACHKGRGSGSGMAINHPVDSLLETSTPYVYERVVKMASQTATSQVTVGTMGRGMPAGYRIRHNLAFVMPYPRVAEQAGRGPICQQCHEDARRVGAVGAVESATITNANGATVTDNPRFQNFPHESTNPNFLVETADDLCTNCHPPDRLP